MKIKIPVSMGILLISLLATTAHGEWELYFKSHRDDVLSIYVDSTIDYFDTNNIRVWIKHEAKIPKYLAEMGKTIKARVEYVQYDCNLKRRRVLQMNALDEDGGVVWSSRDPESWQYISPGEWEKVFIKNICEHDFWWKDRKKN